MSLDQMKVFNEYYMPAVIETLAQRVNVFNGATGGAIMLTTEGFTGDFLQKSFWKALSANARVNRYGANSDVASVDLAQEQENRVKIAGRVGPLRFEPSQMTWLQKPTGEAISVISSEVANLLMQDQLNTAIMSAVTALGKQADSKNDLSATDMISHLALNQGHAKFGDRSGNLICEVMNGATYHQLIANNLNNENRLFSFEGVRVVDVLGKIVVVTDSPALVNGDKFNVLSLANAGIVVSDGGDVISNIQTVNGKERIETTLQMDYTYGLGLRGYSWNTAKPSPLDADLKAPANWTRVASDVKHTAGVLTIVSAKPIAGAGG